MYCGMSYYKKLYYKRTIRGCICNPFMLLYIQNKENKSKESKIMKVMYIINNYQLGSRMRMTPVDKLVEKQRIEG